MADYEWGQSEKQTARGGGLRWLWLLLGFVALMMFLNSRAQQPPARQPARPPIEPTQAERPTPRPNDAQRNGDWSLEEVPGQQTPQVPAATTAQPPESSNPAPPKSTSQGDWQIEEVSPEGKAPLTTEPLKENAGDPAAPASKSTKGDWTVEEIKPKQSSDSEK